MTLIEQVEFNNEEAHKRMFFSIAAMGVSMGLTYPSEWLDNYCHSLTMCMKYSDIPAEEMKAASAMAFFYRSTACDPEEEEMYKNLSDVELCNYMSKVEDAKMKYNHEQLTKHYERTKRDPAADCKV